MLMKSLLLVVAGLALFCTHAESARIGMHSRQLELLLHQLELQQQESFNEKSQQANDGSIWVVLVAGSNGWYNYRHQADVAHAYQIVKNHGVPESNIITMMYDDIANNRQNPRKGVLINKPGGEDVYAGVVIDFKEKEVTPGNFLKVITGDPTLAAAGKKVLKSGPNDRIFIYFTDHGAPGIIAFPNEYLHATDLSKALITMNGKQMYKELVFYLEACESGSMFEEGLLPPSINIYAVTAANAKESSYACYYDDTLKNYLGDCFSVAWMEDSEENDMQTETLQTQFLRVKARTTQSHVLQFGNLSFTSQPVGNFQGNQNPKSNSFDLKELIESGHAVPQEEVDLRILLNKHKSANSLEEQEEHFREIQEHMRVQQETHAIFERILTILHGGNANVLQMSASKKINHFINHRCYAPVLKHFSNTCMALNANSPALSHLYKLANLCQLGSKPERILRAISAACQ